jgi:hypothetical protein
MALARSKVGDSQWNGFTKAANAARPRLIGCSTGDYGTGRTHFWLTGKGPIGILSLDKGLEGVVEQFQETKPIYFKEYDWAPTDTDFSQANAIKLRDELVKDFYHLCEHAHTVIIDKENDIWELFRYAEYGAPTTRPSSYAPLNQRYKKFLNRPKALTINAGYITDLKEKWVSAGEKSGQMEVSGFKGIEGIVHVTMFHERLGEGNFQVTIGKSRGPAATQLQEKTFENLDIPTLGMALYPDSDLPDWK